MFGADGTLGDSLPSHVALWSENALSGSQSINRRKRQPGPHNGPCVSAETGHESDGLDLWKMVRPKPCRP